MNNPSEQSRLIGLDIFRIGAAFLIFLFHSNMHIKNDYGVFNSFISMGAVAMTGFFVLSGYSLSYASTGKELVNWNSIKRFYKKRLIAVWPLYIVTSILFIFFIGKETIVQNVLLSPIEVLGLQSVFSSLFSFSHNGGTWFISCIWICYLLFPFLKMIGDGLSKKEHVFFMIFLGILLLYSPLIVKSFGTNSIYSNLFLDY